MSLPTGTVIGVRIDDVELCIAHAQGLIDELGFSVLSDSSTSFKVREPAIVRCVDCAAGESFPV